MEFPDGPFPDGYMPVANPVNEAGLVLYALQPTRVGVEHVLILRAYEGKKMLAERKVPMNHQNDFGIDVEDMADLERATDEMLVELGRKESDG